jgi:hypothetical protein
VPMRRVPGSAMSGNYDSDRLTRRCICIQEGLWGGWRSRRHLNRSGRGHGLPARLIFSNYFHRVIRINGIHVRGLAPRLSNRRRRSTPTAWQYSAYLDDDARWAHCVPRRRWSLRTTQRREPPSAGSSARAEFDNLPRALRDPARPSPPETTQSPDTRSAGRDSASAPTDT